VSESFNLGPVEEELLRIAFRGGVERAHERSVSTELRAQTQKPISNGRPIDILEALSKYGEAAFESEAGLLGGVAISPYQHR
jgi:hypothetical protein